MKLSIIIINYRGWKRLRLCLESLQCLAEASFSWEVIVIDNHSDDRQLPTFRNDFPEFHFIENKGNFGFAQGCNLGAKRACGDFLLFLNPDTEVTMGVLQQLLYTAEEHPEFTILSCSQIADNGKDTRPYGFSLGLSTSTSFLRSIYKLTHKDFLTTTLGSGARVLFPDWVSGSVVMMEREAFYRLGGWSEDFWMYYEDADLCKRTWKSGGIVAFLPELKIVHNHGGASRVNIRVKAVTKSEVIISRHVYLQKHTTGLKRLLIQSYLVLNNLLLSHLVFALVGLVFFFVPSLYIYTRLYVKIVKYYAGAIQHKTWISTRSVNYKNETRDSYENAPVKAPQLK